MIKVIKESNSESNWKSILNKASEGIAISKVYSQPNIGLSVDIDPDNINKAVSNLKNMGYKLVDKYIDNSKSIHKNDSYYVFINNAESKEDRVVIGIVFGDDWAFINAEYNEIEDADYFKESVNESKKWAVDIYEDDEFYRTKYFTDKHTASKWADQYNYDAEIGDGASDPYLVDESVNMNESLKKADPNDWRYKVLVDAGCDMHNAKMLDSFTFCDVEGLTNIKDNGYKYIKTNNSDYTVGSYTNGKYIITRIAGGYATVDKV